MRWRHCIGCWVLAVLALSSAEIDVLARILAIFKKIAEEYPDEKVFVHTDKQYYLAGEEIWFNAYVTLNPNQLPSRLSKVIYIDLLSGTNVVVDHQTLFCDEGTAHGSIHLPDSLKSGNYWLHAYTKWMLNFDSTFNFRREIKIWNLNEPTTTQSIPALNNIDLQFFPEGGDLVAETDNKIGFKAIGTDGTARKISGTLYNPNGVKILSFATNKLGMGTFVLNPRVSEEYIAVLDSPKAFSVKLPIAAARSISISATPENQENLRVEVLGHGISPSEKFFLIGQIRGVVCYAARVQLRFSRVTAMIPKKKFPTGVCQFTLFDQTGKPIAERLIYNEQQGPTLTVKTSRTSYKPREKAEITMEVRDKEGKPVKAHLSVSVCDAHQVLIDDEADNIKSHFYLTSELKGIIESPFYYFDKRNADRLEALDALLLTQGWRRYVWTNAWTNNFPKIRWSPEQGFTLRGRLLDKTNKKALSNGKITFIEGRRDGEIVITRSNNSGHFAIENLHIFDTLKNSLMAEDRRGRKDVMIELDTAAIGCTWSFTPAVFSESLVEFERRMVKHGLRQKRIDSAYNFTEKNTLLEGIEIRSSRIDRTVDRAYGEPDAVVKSADIPSRGSLWHPLQLLQNRVAGVVVSESGFNSFTVQMRRDVPIILIDDVVVSPDALNFIPASSIERVEVLKGAAGALFGGIGGGGALLFYTKKLDGSDAGSSDGFFALPPIGYNTPKEFYSPKYDVAKPEHVKPDERVVLYWSPMVVADSTGTAHTEYYNHDLDTSIIIIVQGLTDTGMPLYARTSYGIQKK